MITGPHREIYQAVQKLNPEGFVEYARGKSELVSEVSGLLKRIISNVIGREVASEKSFAVNF